MVDECITWNDHVDKVAKKSAKGIECYTRRIIYLTELVRLEPFIIIYNAFVLPHFDYCALVWNNCSKTLQNKLQKLQNKAGRIITGYCYKTASDTVRSELSWDTLEARRKNQLETCMIQIMKGNSIDYLRELFTIHANQTYGLRRSNNRTCSPLTQTKNKRSKAQL